MTQRQERTRLQMAWGPTAEEMKRRANEHLGPGRCLPLGGKWSRSGPWAEGTEDGVTRCLPSMETRKCRSRGQRSVFPRPVLLGESPDLRPAQHLTLWKEENYQQRISSLSVPQPHLAAPTHILRVPLDPGRDPRPSVLCHPHPSSYCRA